jgi:hypothetical protein
MTIPLSQIKNLRCLAFLHPVRMHSARVILAKPYATRQNASDILSQTLDVKRQTTRRQDTVGPFGLGVPPSAQSAHNGKKWSELSRGGKGSVIRIVISVSMRHS